MKKQNNIAAPVTNEHPQVTYYKQLVKDCKAKLKNSRGGEWEMNYQNLNYNQKMLRWAKKQYAK
jgi:hypothetical protein